MNKMMITNGSTSSSQKWNQRNLPLLLIIALCVCLLPFFQCHHSRNFYVFKRVDEIQISRECSCQFLFKFFLRHHPFQDFTSGGVNEANKDLIEVAAQKKSAQSQRYDFHKSVKENLFLAMMMNGSLSKFQLLDIMCLCVAFLLRCLLVGDYWYIYQQKPTVTLKTPNESSF